MQGVEAWSVVSARSDLLWAPARWNSAGLHKGLQKMGNKKQTRNYGLIRAAKASMSKINEDGLVELPLIDFAELQDCDKRAQLLRNIRRRPADWGAFTAKNALAQELVDEALSLMRDFPWEDAKAKYSADPGYCKEGYSCRKLSKFHQRENMYHYTHPLSRSDPSKGAPGYLDFVKRYSSSTLHVYKETLTLFAEAIGLPSTCFMEIFNGHGEFKQTTGFCRYSTLEDCNKEVDCGEVALRDHNDPGSIAIILHDPIPGYQVQDEQGTWRFVKHIPNTIVISVSEALEDLSNHTYISKCHRVFLGSHCRHIIFDGFEPSPDAFISPPQSLLQHDQLPNGYLYAEVEAEFAKRTAEYLAQTNGV